MNNKFLQLRKLLSILTILSFSMIFFSACTSYDTERPHDTAENSASATAASSGGIAKKEGNTTKEPEQNSPVEEDNTKAHQAYQEVLHNMNMDQDLIEPLVSRADSIAFYDIDGNGVDELLTKGGYLGLVIYTYENGEILYIAHEKYGSSIKIYPKESVFILESGHMDHYYQTYHRLHGKKCKIIAEKKWQIHYLNRTGTKTRTTYAYKKKGKKVSKTKFQNYVKSLKTGKCIKRKDLDWQKVSEL